MSVDKGKSLRLVKQWWWLLVVGAIVPALVSHYFASKQPDFYQAKVTLMVGTSLQSANPDPGLMATSKTLADAYAQLVRYDPVTEAVIERLELNRAPEQLAAQVTTWIYPEAQLLEIRVVDTNPQAAALIANTLAEELIARTPAADEVQQFEADFTQQQLDDLRVRIEKVQADIQEVSASMVDLTSAAEIQEAQGRFDALRNMESMYQSTYAQLLSAYTRGSPNILRIFNPAVEPRWPMPRKTTLFVAVAGAAGLGLAVAAVVLIEYLDDAVRWEGEAKQTLLDMPVLGVMTRMRSGKGSVAEVVDPESPSAEMVRALRTNIFLAAGGRGLGTLLITSPDVRAGKTFAVAQLGLAIAAGGRRVVMVDADLRKPTLHEFFDLPNLFGLSELLAGDGPVSGYVWPRGVQETEVENLYLLPGGKPPLDPGWLLASPRFGKLCDALKERADVILIDSPPGLAAPDAAMLASAADGTILVVGAGATSRSKTMKTKERLTKQDKVNLLGVAFNQVKLDGDSHYYRGYGAKRRQPGSGFSYRIRARLRLPLAGDGAAVEDGQAILSLTEMARYLGVRPDTARRWCKNGRLPAFKSRFRWRIKEEDLRTAVGRMVRSEEMHRFSDNVLDQVAAPQVKNGPDAKVIA